MIPSNPPSGNSPSTRVITTPGSSGLAAGVPILRWSQPRSTRSLNDQVDRDVAESRIGPLAEEPSQHVVQGDARASLIRALCALERVHRRSIAALLRQAAEIVARRTPSIPITCGFPLPPLASSVWLERSREVLALARADGWASAGSCLLEHLIARGPARWPSPVRLARAARIVDDGEFARVVVGYAHLVQGQAVMARGVFCELLRDPVHLRHRSRVLEGLALAQEALGHDRQALGAIEGAAEDPEREVSALAQGLSLALTLGDAGRIRHAAARLDMLVDPDSPDFAAVIARLRERRKPLMLRKQVEHRALGTRVALAPSLVELARECRSPSGRVARAMI